MQEPVNFPEWLTEYGPTLKPPVGNREMFPGSSDFVVMVVGGPNQRTDFHVDPYEEVFFQVKGSMHVNVQTDGGPGRVDIHEGDMWVLPRQHAALAPAARGGVDRARVRTDPRARDVGALPLVLQRVQRDRP